MNQAEGADREKYEETTFLLFNNFYVKVARASSESKFLPGMFSFLSSTLLLER